MPHCLATELVIKGDLLEYPVDEHERDTPGGHQLVTVHFGGLKPRRHSTTSSSAWSTRLVDEACRRGWSMRLASETGRRGRARRSASDKLHSRPALSTYRHGYWTSRRFLLLCRSVLPLYSQEGRTISPPSP
jgi:hypothetical protein